MAGLSARPVIALLSRDPLTLDVVSAELSNRYGSDYDVLCHRDPTEGLAALRDRAANGSPVAIVLSAIGSEDLRHGDGLDTTALGAVAITVVLVSMAVVGVTTLMLAASPDRAPAPGASRAG